MKMSVDDLGKAFDTIIGIVRNSIGDEVEFDSDYYWTIGFPDRKNFQGDPRLGVGSLDDDIEGIVKSISGLNPFGAIDFERLANIVLEISDRDLYPLFQWDKLDVPDEDDEDA